jgi:3-hydroxyisobutyrate dehydrogenase-like beta-hydroxyacid dehydrogenase
MRIAFLGFGEAARAFRESLAGKDPALRFAAYDILLDTQGVDGDCGQAMRTHGVEIVPTPERLPAGADWIVSAVTADQSLQAARSVAPCARPGQVFLDINSVSPQRKRDTAGLFAPAGALYVDMAVMAPVHPKGHRTPVLVAGPVDGNVTEILKRLDFDFETVGPEAGAATAIKMVRSVFVKGLEAITVETLLAASASGCLDHIMNSLGKTYPGLGLHDLAPYQFERSLRHGRRRAAEMRESAAMLDELGLSGRLAEAIAEVHDTMGRLGCETVREQAFEAGLQTLLALRRQ